MAVERSAFFTTLCVPSEQGPHVILLQISASGEDVECKSSPGTKKACGPLERKTSFSYLVFPSMVEDIKYCDTPGLSLSF